MIGFTHRVALTKACSRGSPPAVSPNLLTPRLLAPLHFTHSLGQPFPEGPCPAAGPSQRLRSYGYPGLAPPPPSQGHNAISTLTQPARFALPAFVSQPLLVSFALFPARRLNRGWQGNSAAGGRVCSSRENEDPSCGACSGAFICCIPAWCAHISPSPPLPPLPHTHTHTHTHMCTHAHLPHRAVHPRPQVSTGFNHVSSHCPGKDTLQSATICRSDWASHQSSSRPFLMRYPL